MNPAFDLIDVSHTVEDGLVTYQGLPPAVITDYLTRAASRERYAPGTEFQIGKIEMVANTGTYLDSPFHRYADGSDLSQLNLHSLANLDGIVVRQVGATERGIRSAALKDLDVRGKAVLFHTGWDRFWRTGDYASGSHPFVATETAEYLAEHGAALVGIDSFNIDDTANGERPAHSILLAKGIPILEHMCGLGDLPEAGFKFFAVPVKVRGMGTFPVRAFGIVPQT
ncbi:MAG: cyclase family protein [Pyrinomonadaceae bacterium]